MTTQCMRDSAVGDKWIQEASALNPVQSLGDGVFLSGLVRLGWVFRQKKEDDWTPCIQAVREHLKGMLNERR